MTELKLKYEGVSCSCWQLCGRVERGLMEIRINPEDRNVLFSNSISRREVIERKFAFKKLTTN
jgi:hypothetical protein